MDERGLRTIGYQGASLEALLAALTDTSVRRVIDVREVPYSRRRAFSKRALSEALAAAGVQYGHLKGLGTPKAGRDAARAGDRASFERIFAAHMRTAVARADLATAIELAAAGNACLLCYERDPQACHRSIVAAEIQTRTAMPVTHLTPAEVQGTLL